MTKSSSSKTPMDSPPPKHPSLPPSPPQTEFPTAANPLATATTATKNPTLDMDSPPALDSKTLKPPPLSESQISLAAPSVPPLKDSTASVLPLKDSTFDTTLKPQVTATKNPTLDMDSPHSKTLKPPPLSKSQISLAAPSVPSLKDSTFDTTLKPQVPRPLTEQLPTVKDPTLDVKEPVLLPVEGEEMPTYIPGVGPAIPIPPTPRQVASSSLPQPASPAIPVPIPLIAPVQPESDSDSVQPESDSDSDSGGQDWGDFFDCWG